MNKIIETHCHLDYLKAAALEEILSACKEVGIEKIITISVEPDNLDAVFELSQNYPQIFCSQGVHPHDAKLYTQEAHDKIIERAKSQKKVVAIGEIGLDYHYDNSPRDIQKQVFEKQLQIASDLDLPVIIHSRDADEDTKSILKNFETTLKRKGVIHSYTSGKELAEYALDQNFYLGFNGIITFKKAQNVRDIVEITPTEQILLETDSPFLTPVPHRGKENNPSYLPFIAQKVAELKEIDLEDLLKITYQNSHQLFKLES